MMGLSALTAGIGIASYYTKRLNTTLFEHDTLSKLTDRLSDLIAPSLLLLYTGAVSWVFSRSNMDSIAWLPWLNEFKMSGLEKFLWGSLPLLPSAAAAGWMSAKDIRKVLDSFYQGGRANIFVTNFLAVSSLFYFAAFMLYRYTSTAVMDFRTLGDTNRLLDLSGPAMLFSSVALSYLAFLSFKNEGRNDVSGEETRYNKKALAYSVGSLGLFFGSFFAGWGAQDSSMMDFMGIPLSALLLLADTQTILHAIGFQCAQFRTLSPAGNRPENDDFCLRHFNRVRTAAAIVVKPCMSWAEGGRAASMAPFLNRNCKIRTFMVQLGTYPLLWLIGLRFGIRRGQDEIEKCEKSLEQIEKRLKSCLSMFSPNGAFRELRRAILAGTADRAFLRQKQTELGNILVALGGRYIKEFAPPVEANAQEIEKNFETEGIDISRYFDITGDGAGRVHRPKEDINALVDRDLADKKLSVKEARVVGAIYLACLGDKGARADRLTWIARGQELIAEGERLIKTAEKDEIYSGEELESEWRYYLHLFSVQVSVGANRNELNANSRISKAECQDAWRDFYGLTAYEVLHAQKVGEEYKNAAYTRVAGTHVMRENPEWDYDMPEVDPGDPSKNRFIFVPREDFPELRSEHKQEAHSPEIAAVDNSCYWYGWRYDEKTQKYYRDKSYDASKLDRSGPKAVFREGGKDGCFVIYIRGQKSPLLFSMEDFGEPPWMLLDELEKLAGPLNPAKIPDLDRLNELVQDKDLYLKLKPALDKKRAELESETAPYRDKPFEDLEEDQQKNVLEYQKMVAILEQEKETAAFRGQAGPATDKERHMIMVLNRMAMGALIPKEICPLTPLLAIPRQELDGRDVNAYYRNRLPAVHNFLFYDIETNIDSEFVDIKTTEVGGAVLEKDKKRLFLKVTFLRDRTCYLPLDVVTRQRLSLSHITEKLHPAFFGLEPMRATMYLKVTTTANREPYILPYAPIDNKTAFPIITKPLKKPITTKKQLRSYIGDYRNIARIAIGPDSITLAVRPESFTNSGKIRITITMPKPAGFPKEVTEVSQIEGSGNAVENFIDALFASLDKMSDEDAVNGLRAEITFDWRTIRSAKLAEGIGGSTILKAKCDLGEYGEEEMDLPSSIYLPPMFSECEKIDKIDFEVFDRRVGEMPFVRYEYRFNTRQEAEEFSKDLSVTEGLIYQVFEEEADGKKHYSVFTFAFVGSDMRLRDIDADTVRRSDVRLEEHGGMQMMRLVAKKRMKKLFQLHGLQSLLSEGTTGSKEAEITAVSARSAKAGKAWLMEYRWDRYFLIDPGRPIPQKAVLAKYEREGDEYFLVYYDKDENRLEAAELPDPMSKITYEIFYKIARHRSDSRCGVQTKEGNFVPLPIVPEKGVTVHVETIEFKDHLIYRDSSGKDLFALECPADLAATRGKLDVVSAPNILYEEGKGGVSSFAVRDPLPCKAENLIDVQPKGEGLEVTEQKYRVKATSTELDDLPFADLVNNVSIVNSDRSSLTLRFDYSGSHASIEKRISRRSLVNCNGSGSSFWLPKAADDIYQGDNRDQWGDPLKLSLLLKDGRLYLRFTVIERHDMEAPEAFKAKEGEKLSIAANNSLARVTKAGRSVWVATQEPVTGLDDMFTEGRATSPSLRRGRMGIVVFPQHAVTNLPFNYGLTDQKTFYGELIWGSRGDHGSGGYYGAAPYPWMKPLGLWGTGGSIQGYRSLTGSAINSGTPVCRDIRAAQLEYGVVQNEIEYRHGKFLHLNEYTDIIEDYFESRGLVHDNGLDTIFLPTIVAYGKAPEKAKQWIEQRLRWMASLGLGPKRILPNLADDVSARWSNLLGSGDRATFYTPEGLYQEATGCTWYYAGSVRLARAIAPIAFFLGVYAYAADANVFPMLVFGTLFAPLGTYLYGMAKEGESVYNLLFKLNGVFDYLSIGLNEKVLPAGNFVPFLGKPLSFQSICKIMDEGEGPFILTDAAGGPLPPRFAAWQKLLITMEIGAGLMGASGLARMDTSSMPQMETYGAHELSSFALQMNTIWPLLTAYIDSVGLELIMDNQKKNLP